MAHRQLSGSSTSRCDVSPRRLYIARAFHAGGGFSDVAGSALQRESADLKCRASCWQGGTSLEQWSWRLQHRI